MSDEIIAKLKQDLEDVTAAKAKDAQMAATYYSECQQLRQELAALRAEVGELNKTNYDCGTKFRELELKYLRLIESQQSPPPEQPQEDRCPLCNDLITRTETMAECKACDVRSVVEQPQEKKKGLVSEALKRQGINPDTVKKETAELAAISPKRFESDIDGQPQGEAYPEFDEVVVISPDVYVSYGDSVGTVQFKEMVRVYRASLSSQPQAEPDGFDSELETLWQLVLNADNLTDPDSYQKERVRFKELVAKRVVPVKLLKMEG